MAIAIKKQYICTCDKCGISLIFEEDKLINVIHKIRKVRWTTDGYNCRCSKCRTTNPDEEERRK